MCVSIYVCIDHPAHAHACTSTNVLCTEGLCTYGVPKVPMYPSACICGRTHAAHAHTRSRTRARTPARTHAHRHCAYTLCRAGCVCLCARACVCACQRAQMRESGLFQGVDTIHSVSNVSYIEPISKSICSKGTQCHSRHHTRGCTPSCSPRRPYQAHVRARAHAHT
jgi:hypothetical protein